MLWVQMQGKVCLGITKAINKTSKTYSFAFIESVVFKMVFQMLFSNLFVSKDGNLINEDCTPWNWKSIQLKYIL